MDTKFNNLIIQWGHVQARQYGNYAADNTDLTLPIAYSSWVLSFASTNNRSSVFVQADSTEYKLTGLLIGRVNNNNGPTSIDCMWLTIGY